MITPELQKELDALLETASSDLVRTLRALLALRDAPPDRIDITLVKPIELGGETISTISLREPTAGEIEDFERSPQTLMTTAISTLAAIPHASAKKLGARDFNACRDYLLYFFTTSAPQTP